MEILGDQSDGPAVGIVFDDAVFVEHAELSVVKPCLYPPSDVIRDVRGWLACEIRNNTSCERPHVNGAIRLPENFEHSATVRIR